MRDYVHIENVSKFFGEEQVLKEINHDFAQGMVHGIMGNNGSGKTVLFKCICGFMHPDEGRIRVNHVTIGHTRDFPENTGIIIESPGFLPHMTGFRNLQILASLNGKIRRQDIIHALETVGLPPGLKKPVSKYSLGMRQRLGIAQAIMEDPEFLVLDEPFNGLDKQGADHIRQVLLELKKRGKTILLTSHNMKDMEVLCDTVCEMDAGVLQEV